MGSFNFCWFYIKLSFSNWRYSKEYSDYSRLFPVNRVADGITFFSKETKKRYRPKRTLFSSKISSNLFSSKIKKNEEIDVFQISFTLFIHVSDSIYPRKMCSTPLIMRLFCFLFSISSMKIHCSFLKSKWLHLDIHG